MSTESQPERQPERGRGKQSRARTSGAGQVTKAAVAPTHLVVFREPSEQNAKVVADGLRLRARSSMSIRSGCHVMGRAGDAHPAARVYDRLSVASVTATPDEVEALRKQDRVAEVVLNEVRRLPPIIEMDALGQSAIDFGGGQSLQEARIRGFLEGLRTAADMTLDMMNGTPSTLRQPIGMDLTKPAQSDISWGLAAIGIGLQHEATGKGIKVAVLDTGIDAEHPDLQARITASETFVASKNAHDGNGHGTHCAGVIAGATIPSVGPRYGVAPGVELLIGKVLSDAGSGRDDQILEAIDWAVDQGAKIISMSLGSPRERGQPFSAAYEQVAKVLRLSGTLIVAAAGNESNRPWWTKPVGNPAACPSIMSVAAIRQDLAIAPFSCGSLDEIGQVDLSAPGVAVRSAWTGGGYKSISGTSMATPHIAGVAAMLAESDPGGLWQRLTRACRSLGSTADFGAGLLQAPGAAG